MNITAGKYNGRKIIAPDENITRPTLSKVRMALFNTLQSLIDFEGASFLDMFAGSGTTGHASEQNGRNSIMIDENQEAINAMKERYTAYELNYKIE